MEKIEVIQKVNAFLAEDFEIDEALLVPENDIRKDVGIDSLEVVDIIVCVNDVFGFKPTAEQMKQVKTLDNFYDLIVANVD